MSSSPPGNRISATLSPGILLLSNGKPAIGARTSNAAAVDWLVYEIGVEEDKVSVESEYGTYTITILQDVFMINNITKFIIIQKIFNTKYNGLISIGLYDDGIKLNMPSDARGISNKGWYDTKKEALDMIKKDFDIVEKNFSLYLHPKFEFIKNENI